MKMYLTIMGLALAISHCTGARAAEKAPPMYLNTKGEKLQPTEALLSAAQGGQVYKCVLTEAKVSKSGTSISLKNVKK